MKIAILAFDNFTDIDLVLHWDLLSRVKYIGGHKNWEVQILGTKKVHTSFLGLPIPTTGSVDSISEADGVIICSGKGARVLIDNKNYLENLNLNPEKQFIGAQCSGSLILGALGYLEGQKVSAYPPILNELKDYGAVLEDRSLAVAGNIATASSCLAGQYLSEWMMKSLVGPEITAKVMETAMPIGAL